MTNQAFRQCRCCNTSWSNWEHFIRDPRIRIVGLQAVPRLVKANVVVFIHEGCGTISILTSKLKELLSFESKSNACNTQDCLGCFRDVAELSACDHNCVIAEDRELTRHILAIKGQGVV